MNLKTIKSFTLGIFTLSLLTGCGVVHLSQNQENTKNRDNNIYMFIGTYTAKGSNGIYVYKVDTITGKSAFVSTTHIDDPSYLAVSKDNQRLYAVTERETQEESSVSSFAFDWDSGDLSFISSQPAGGAAPCHVALSPDEKLLVTANYGGGSFSQYDISGQGQLLYRSTISFSGQGKDPERQTQSHVHFGAFTPDQNYLLVNDLGLDKIYKYRLEDQDRLVEGTPASYDVQPGSGPRHLVFHPNGNFAYLITEISGDVDVFTYQEGSLTQIQTIKADPVGARGSGDIQITPDGKFLYASNRLKNDGLAIFSVSPQNGKLKKIGYRKTGIHPRSFAITPNGKYLFVANRDSDSVQLFRIKKDGKLVDLLEEIPVSMPVCVKFSN